MIERAVLLVAALAVVWVAVAVRTARTRRRATASGVAGHPSVLFFHGPHCHACRAQADQLGQLGGVRVVAVDAAADPEAARGHGIWTVPTTVVLRGDGTVAAVNPGLVPAGRLRDQLAVR